MDEDISKASAGLAWGAGRACWVTALLFSLWPWEHAGARGAARTGLHVHEAGGHPHEAVVAAAAERRSALPPNRGAGAAAQQLRVGWAGEGGEMDLSEIEASKSQGCEASEVCGVLGRSVLPCTRCWWLVRSHGRRNDFVHTLHLKGRTSSCLRSCN
jgi:hypothetical protein